MLVTPALLINTLKVLRSAPVVSFDTETTGLYSWRGDRLFSIIVSTQHEDFYFDFQETLNREVIGMVAEATVGQSTKTVYMHNAKFDMSMLYQDGVRDFSARIFDTMVMGRLLKNDLMSYSLDSLVRLWLGQEKDDQLKKYAIANGHWEWERKPGAKQRKKRILFHKLPLHIVQTYGEKDGRLTFMLGQYLEDELGKISAQTPEGKPNIQQVVDLELQTTKTLFEMETDGVTLDLDFTKKGFAHETGRSAAAMAEFQMVTQKPLVNSAKSLFDIFTEHSPEDADKFGTTAKGNVSFTGDVLDGLSSPLAATVREYRDAEKRAGTYYGNFIHFVGSDGKIHPNFRQGGTATGRLSCSDPNLQNVNKEDVGGEFIVRRCFIPSVHNLWGSLDYDQMEYRLMLDVAGEMGVIRQVLEGVDVHTATAQLMGVPRSQAKTINFMLLYGGGVAKLAAALGIRVSQAKELKQLYFARLPRVSALITAITEAASKRRCIHNWYGRLYRFPDPRFAYKAPNYYIQGGCADVVKLAMNKCQDHVKAKKAESKIILQVHDELDVDLRPNELELMEELRVVMQNVYPHKHLPLTAGASISEFSWADVEDMDEWRNKKKAISQIG